MQETQKMQVKSLGQEDSLEEEMAIHSGVLPGKSHGAGRATIHRVTKSQTWLSTCAASLWEKLDLEEENNLLGFKANILMNVITGTTAKPYLGIGWTQEYHL